MERKLAEERKGKKDDILDRVGSFVGVGKSADLKKENAELKAKLERLKEAFPKALEKEVKKQTEPLIRERDAALRKAESAKRHGERIAEEKDWANDLLRDRLHSCRVVLHIFAAMLYAVSDVFKRAMRAIIEYGTAQYKSIFSDSEAADIRSVMREYGEHEEERKAVGEWMCDYAQTLQPIDETNSRMVRKEVGDIAKGKYDWRIDQDQGCGISR